MIRALTLEDFAEPAKELFQAEPFLAEIPENMAPSDEDMATFDEGYRSGWDDCAKAEADTNRRIGADLAANLDALSLSYAEARADVLAALGPLFEDIAAQLLPRLAAEAVAPAVIAELRAAAEAASAGRAVVCAAPAALPALTRLIEMQEGLDVDLQAEPAFAEGQVSLRFAAERRDIDLSDAAHRMADAIRSFVAQESATPPPQEPPEGCA
jgi:flagellar assembly protein FliH